MKIIKTILTYPKYIIYSLFLVPIALSLVAMVTLQGTLSAAGEGQCAPTKRDALGPFYVSNTPIVEQLNQFVTNGEAILIQGEIRSSIEPYAPIPGAKIEIWQTDDNGRYYPQNNGDVRDYSKREIDLRGTVISESDGTFSVMSLNPGKYPGRPEHIHYKVSAPGYKTLVTQHYVDGSKSRYPCRAANVDRSVEPPVFPAPAIYLQKG